MTFSMKLPVGKGKKKPLAMPLASGIKPYGLVRSKKDTKSKEFSSGFNAFAAAADDRHKQEAENKDCKDLDRRPVGTDAARSFQQNLADKIQAQALAEDAAVFDYDAVYDDMKNRRESKAAKHAVQRELEKKMPKYIGTLLQQAKIREVENERIRERRLLHERNTDEAQYGDKEKLVSASYKRKLQEMQKWDAEDARLAAMEEQEDVTKQGEHAMTGFYVNLNKNIAMGGTTANARSAYTAKETLPRKTRRVELARAAQGHERDGADEPKSAKTHDDGATKNARSGKQRDDCQALPAHDILRESMDSHIKTNVSSLPTDKLEEPEPSKEDAIAAAKARFLTRKAHRKASTT